MNPGLPRVLLVLVVLLVASSGAAEEATPRSAATPTAIARLLEVLALGGYAPGDTAPPFEAFTLDGRSVTLSELKGRVVVVAFWATWCPPCKEELPVFDRIQRARGPRGLTVVGINVRERARTVRPYAQALALTFPILLDLDGDIAKQYGVVGLPTTFLIGRNGAPVGRAIGPRVWDSEPARAILEALLEQPPNP